MWYYLLHIRMYVHVVLPTAHVHVHVVYMYMWYYLLHMYMYLLYMYMYTVVMSCSCCITSHCAHVMAIIAEGVELFESWCIWSSSKTSTGC